MGDVWLKNGEMRQVSRVNKLNLIESAMIKYKMREMLDAKNFFIIYLYVLFLIFFRAGLLEVFWV
jgi:hypothetical protein